MEDVTLVADLSTTLTLAYIDPGVASMAIQAIFVLVFGSLMAWIVSPWNFVKSLLARKKQQPEPSENDT